MVIPWHYSGFLALIHFQVAISILALGKRMLSYSYCSDVQASRPCTGTCWAPHRSRVLHSWARRQLHTRIHIHIQPYTETQCLVLEMYPVLFSKPAARVEILRCNQAPAVHFSVCLLCASEAHRAMLRWNMCFWSNMSTVLLPSWDNLTFGAQITMVAFAALAFVPPCTFASISARLSTFTCK